MHHIPSLPLVSLLIEVIRGGLKPRLHNLHSYSGSCTSENQNLFSMIVMHSGKSKSFTWSPNLVQHSPKTLLIIWCCIRLCLIMAYEFLNSAISNSNYKQFLSKDRNLINTSVKFILFSFTYQMFSGKENSAHVNTSSKHKSIFPKNRQHEFIKFWYVVEDRQWLELHE